MRFTRGLTLGLFLCSLSAGALRADDEIILRGKQKLYGTIKSENGFGVMIEERKELIPASEILDIRYDKRIKEDPSRELYFEARDKEAQVEKSKNPRDSLRAAVQAYDAVLNKIPKVDTLAAYRRNVEFRIAFLRGRMAAEFDESPTLAMKALKDFKKDYPESWQISLCLQRLAELQIAQGKVDDAEKTYAELGEAKVADDIKQNAEFLAAKLSMQTGKLKLAETRFKALVEKLPKTNPIYLKSLVAQTECLSQDKQIDQANVLLRKMLKETSDTNLKALAHNALGKNFYDQQKYKEARWEFLWVDVVYNQNKLEHAKSLYYLWKSFSELGEAERAQECLEALMSSQFADVDFQRKAKAETKK